MYSQQNRKHSTCTAFLHSHGFQLTGLNISKLSILPAEQINTISRDLYDPYDWLMFAPDNNSKKTISNHTCWPSPANSNNIWMDFQNSDPITFITSSPEALKLSKQALNFPEGLFKRGSVWTFVWDSQFPSEVEPTSIGSHVPPPGKHCCRVILKQASERELWNKLSRHWWKWTWNLLRTRLLQEVL